MPLPAADRFRRHGEAVGRGKYQPFLFGADGVVEVAEGDSELDVELDCFEIERVSVLRSIAARKRIDFSWRTKASLE